MQTEFCPLCSKNGAKVRVRAYQLNLEEAVFMCSTEECTWPVGYHELLFMGNPMGKYYSKDWPEVANRFLANHLQKQRDSLSELSAYTPPQTPGHSKDAIHDTTTESSSSLSLVKEDDLFAQEPSTSESKPFEIPVIDFVGDGDDPPSFEEKIVSPEPLLGHKSEKILVILKDSSGIKLTSKTDNVVANPFAKSSTSSSASLVDKSASIIDEKPSFGVSERNVASDNLQFKKYRVIGKKSKSFTYKKQFDIFDDIKKAKSTNEQSKAKIAIKSKLDLDKMKPNEIKEVLFVNSKSKTNDLVKIKVEANASKVIKLEAQDRLIKVERKICRADVNSTIQVDKKACVASSLIQIPNSDSNDIKVEGNVSLESLSKQSNESAHYDLDTLMKASPADLESGESWSGADQNLESLLAMLEDDAPTDVDELLNDDATTSKNVLLGAQPEGSLLTVDKPLDALSLNDSPSTSNAATLSKLPDLDDPMNDHASNSNAAALSKLPILDDSMDDNASTSNATLPSEPSKDTIVNVKVEKVKVEVVKKEMDLDSIIEDDTLQCSIEDTDDPFFASLFSPAASSFN